MLKTTNYLIKNTDDLMPVAYACISKIRTSGLQGKATLSIQKSRENCELVRQGKLDAKHEVTIDFVVDYDKHISTLIYETAKGYTEYEGWDEETSQVVMKKHPNHFHGWEDEIV